MQKSAQSQGCAHEPRASAPPAPATPASAAIPVEHAPTLLKLQAPIDAFRLWLNEHLLRWFPGAASFLWVLHLVVACTLTILARGCWEG